MQVKSTFKLQKRFLLMELTAINCDRNNGRSVL